MTMPEVTLTEDERALLLNLRIRVGAFIASPEYETERLRADEGSGGGHGFHFRFTKSAIVGTWHEFIPDQWRSDGTVIRWRYGELLREVTVTYKRLQRWVESLPAEVRAQALTWYRTYPEDTRDLAALDELVLQLLADPVPAADPEPVDLLDLLEEANA